MSEHDFDKRMGVCRKCRRHAREIIGWSCAPIAVNDAAGERALHDWKRRYTWNGTPYECTQIMAPGGEVHHLPSPILLRTGHTYEYGTLYGTIWIKDVTETPAEGATAPNKKYGEWLVYDETMNNPPGFWETLRAKSPAKPSNKPAESVPSIGHALRQVNRPASLVGALSRYMGK
ncbi:MAG TPA: hypothetical protein VEA41_07925 [Salinarimonas sp.]|nr:hypothetical protein [Salinarimonas sp.]